MAAGDFVSREGREDAKHAKALHAPKALSLIARSRLYFSEGGSAVWKETSRLSHLRDLRVNPFTSLQTGRMPT